MAERTYGLASWVLAERIFRPLQPNAHERTRTRSPALCRVGGAAVLVAEVAPK